MGTYPRKFWESIRVDSCRSKSQCRFFNTDAASHCDRSVVGWSVSDSVASSTMLRKISPDAPSPDCGGLSIESSLKQIVFLSEFVLSEQEIFLVQELTCGREVSC